MNKCNYNVAEGYFSEYDKTVKSGKDVSIVLNSFKDGNSVVAQYGDTLVIGSFINLGYMGSKSIEKGNVKVELALVNDDIVLPRKKEEYILNYITNIMNVCIILEEYRSYTISFRLQLRLISSCPSFLDIMYCSLISLFTIVLQKGIHIYDTFIPCYSYDNIREDIDCNETPYVFFVYGIYSEQVIMLNVHGPLEFDRLKYAVESAKDHGITMFKPLKEQITSYFIEQSQCETTRL